MRALTRQERILGQSPAERELIDLLNGLDIPSVPQRAMGPYNIDVAVEVPRVAVEVFGGGFHCFGHHLARHVRRTKYLLNRGWTVVIVWVDLRRYPLGIGCAKKIKALVDLIGEQPPSRGEYRVIRGNGKSPPVAERYLNTQTFIEALGGGDDAAHRHDEISR